MEKTFENADYWTNEDNDIFFYSLDEVNENKDKYNEIYAVHSNLLISDQDGIYIPKVFFDDFGFEMWGLNKGDYSELSNPENEFYWDYWNVLLKKAKTTINGNDFYLEQDGGLYAKCYIISNF